MKFSEDKIVEFYDRLSTFLTDYESGHVRELDLYIFLSDLHEDLAYILN